jgi:hypothetical protein
MNSPSPRCFPARQPWRADQLLNSRRWLPPTTIVLAFVERHPAAILRLAGSRRGPHALLSATKILIAREGSLHLPSELLAQQQAMAQSLRHASSPEERSELALAWVARHAGFWRQCQIRRYQAIADRLRRRILIRLLNAPARCGARASAQPERAS